VKREYIILLIILAMGLLDLHQTSSAYAKEMSFEEDIEKYKTEAKSLISSANDPKLADTTKSLKGFTDNPEEGSLNEEDLRIKGDEKIKGKNIKENEEEGEREAINAVKHSNANNPHRSKYTVTKLKNKAFMKKSAAIVENPISGLNVAANAGCKIVGGDKGGENVSFEEYYVDVEDMRVKEVKHTCEEDEDKLFYCNRSIKDVKCASKSDCGRDMGKINIEELGGHLTSSGRLHHDQRSLTWEYTYPNLSFTSEQGGGVRERYCRDQCGVKNSDCCKKTIATGRFRLSNVSEVGAFRLKEAGFDNHGMIKLNGRVVYNTWGGDKLEIAKECYPSRETYVDAGSGRGGACNLHNGTNLNNKMDIELKQHLKEGWNELEVTWIYAVRGQYKIKIEARQRRCKKFNEKTEVKCEYVD